MDLVKLGENGMPALWLGHTITESIEGLSSNKGFGDTGDGGSEDGDNRSYKEKIFDFVKDLISGGTGATVVGGTTLLGKAKNFFGKTKETLKGKGGSILKGIGTAAGAIWMTKDGLDELEKAEELGVSKGNAFISGALGGQFDESKGLDALNENISSNTTKGFLASSLAGPLQPAVAMVAGGLGAVGADNIAVSNKNLIENIKSGFDEEVIYEQKKALMIRNLESQFNTKRMSEEAFNDFMKKADELPTEEFVDNYYGLLSQELVQDTFNAFENFNAGMVSAIIPMANMKEGLKAESSLTDLDIISKYAEGDTRITEAMRNSAIERMIQLDAVDSKKSNNKNAYFKDIDYTENIYSFYEDIAKGLLGNIKAETGILTDPHKFSLFLESVANDEYLMNKLSEEGQLGIQELMNQGYRIDTSSKEWKKIRKIKMHILILFIKVLEKIIFTVQI